MEQRPIQSFYCVYLLRSTVSSKSLYIGSTPHPRRRLAQHNGEVPGGANRTSRSELKPWEMVCIVTGFPSSIAALQFEWAWQNPHISTKIPHGQRVSGSKRKTRRGRTKIVPPKTITAKLESLHLLLRVDAFSRWPLSLRFFVEDVYSIWGLWCQRESIPLRKSIKVLFDLRYEEGNNSTEMRIRNKAGDDSDELPTPRSQAPASKGRKKQRWGLNGEGGVQGLDISNDYLERHLKKSRDILQLDSDLICNICLRSFSEGYSLIVVCPHTFCEHIAHITCLADEFLQQEKHGNLSYRGRALRPILPVDGKCPRCKKETPWVDLVKELSIRTRSKLKTKKNTVVPRDEEREEDEDDGEDEEDDEEDGEDDEDDEDVEDVEDDEDDEDDGEDGEDQENITAADLAEAPEELERELFEFEDHGTDMDSVLSDVGETGKAKRKKTAKGKGKTQEKKVLPAVIENIVEEPFGDAESEIKSKKGRGKEKKGKVKVRAKEIPLFKGNRSKEKRTRGKAKLVPTTMAEDSDVDSMVSESNVKKGEVKAKILPVVIEDSDWDGVDIII